MPCDSAVAARSTADSGTVARRRASGRDGDAVGSSGHGIVSGHGVVSGSGGTSRRDGRPAKRSRAVATPRRRRGTAACPAGGDPAGGTEESDRMSDATSVVSLAAAHVETLMAASHSFGRSTGSSTEIVRAFDRTYVRRSTRGHRQFPATRRNQLVHAFELDRWSGYGHVTPVALFPHRAPRIGSPGAGWQPA